MKKLLCLSLLPLILLLITGCAQEEASAGQLDYDETKKMVVDILKTDDGKKAIQDIMTDEQLRKELIMDQTVVSDTIKTTLTSEDGAAFWKKNFEDPKFAEAMAKSMQTEHEKMLKNLMNDPDYRKKMVEIMKDPELETELTNVLKSNEYREHLKTVISETLENPLYQVKMQELLQKAVEKESKEAEKKEE
jgi:spore germination protein D